MGIQVPLLVIDRRHVSVMSTLFSNRRVRTLKVSMTLELLLELVCGYRMLFEVPDEIQDVTRSSGMVRRRRFIYGKSLFGHRKCSGVYRYCTRTTERVPGVHQEGPPAPEGPMG